MLKNIFAILALMLGIVLAVVAGVAIGSLLPSGSGDADIRVGGMGVQVQNVNTSIAGRLARRAANLKEIPQVTDAMLVEAVRAVMDNARRGDVNAAAFLLDLSAAQKALAAEQAKAAAATRPTTGKS
jgi:hypothetical protein